MTTLKKLCAKYKNGNWPDKDTTHSYIDIYEEILAPYRETAKNILEIGLMNGESLRMWSEYFLGTVYGMDCDIRPIGGMVDLSQTIMEYNVKIGDATNEADIEKFFSGIKFDVVLDDGNHLTSSQVKTFSLLKNKMSWGGIYIIEDCSDIDKDKEVYLSLHDNVEIIDRRSKKNRFDDVLALIHF